MNRKKHKMEDTDTENTAPAADSVEDAVSDEDNEATRQMEKLAEENDRAARERDEYLNLAQRVKADFENYKRRNQNVREDAYNDGVWDTLGKFLPVLDNLDRAACSNGGEEALREGVQLVLKQFCGILSAAGIEEIKAEGITFDPNLHHAVLQEAVEGEECGKVLSVLQKGYIKDGRVLRHCMVKVAE